MSKVLKLRRGRRSTMLGTKASTVLASGELFGLVPDTGAGTGAMDLYMGDGTTAFSSLPVAIHGDPSAAEITVTADASTTATAALANVVTGRTLGAIVGSLKQAVTKNATSITQINDDFVQKTDYATSSAYGVVKVDGSTIVASNGVISSNATSGIDYSLSGTTLTITDTRGELSFNSSTSTLSITI